MLDQTKTEIRAKETIRILRLHINKKLTFNQHICKVIQKAKNTALGSHILANMIKGVSQMQLCTMYRACVVLVIMYTCPIWCTGKRVHLERLTKVQNYVMRHMAGVFRTMPTKMLEVDMAVPLLGIMLDMVVGSYANRLHKIKETNPIIE
ncbi:hypothetical protein J132_05965 [Termitomyces sp. J132]|nr:hypothetical protein J132_05965 [Termitomyces sp. J132]